MKLRQKMSIDTNNLPCYPQVKILTHPEISTFKYNEDALIQGCVTTFRTYGQYYSGTHAIQTLDLIEWWVTCYFLPK